MGSSIAARLSVAKDRPNAERAAAIVELREATGRDPDNSGPHLHRALGRAFLRAGQIAKAEASFKLAITSRDDFAQAPADRTG